MTNLYEEMEKTDPTDTTASVDTLLVEQARGVEDGLLPMEREDSNEDEERRLLYVGMTRAKDELILTSTKARAFQGARIHPKPSRFLDGISADVMRREEGEPRKRAKQEQLALF